MGNRKTLAKDFTRGSIPRALAEFTVPLYLSNLLQIAYNIADMAIVGQFVGKTGLSAVTIGGDVSNFMAFVAMGFGNAGQVLISQCIGAKELKKAGTLIANMLKFILSVAVVLTAICLWAQEDVLRFMNTPPEAWDGALEYSTVCMSGLVFLYGYNITGAILRGLGDSKHPFIFVGMAAILNVVLDLVLVAGFEFGAMGAGLATVISQGISFSACAIFLVRNRDRLGFSLDAHDFRHWDMAIIGKLVRLGLPMAIKGASIQTSKLFVNSWINSYGVAVSAFAGIANKINGMSNLLSNAMNTAGSSMVGQNIGAGKYERVKKIIATVATVTLTLAATISLLIFAFPEMIFGFFTDDADVISLVGEYLPIAVLIFFGSACRAPMNALIDGSGSTAMNFCTALFDGILLRIGLSVLFGLYLEMGYWGFWLGDALAGFTPLVIGMTFLASGKWKNAKV